MEFDLPKDLSSIIKVVGVGGGGSNAVNHMFNQGIKGVDFVVCNTDQQALDMSPVPLKIQLGASLTEGRGAGAIPEIGKNAAIENIEDIRAFLSKGTKMVFITAGMGGGTGTGAAPVIARVAKELDILTVGIVTVPFAFEGKKRKQQAEEGLQEMRANVDTLLIINNDRLREMYGNLSLGSAFTQADNVLAIAAKGIAEVISVTGLINVDFNDVNTVMKNSGVAIMGSSTAEGEHRAIEAVKSALSSPLLNDNDIKGAKYVLLNITYGNKEILMDEIGIITDYIQDEAGSTADVIWGHGYDETLGDSINLTLIATGFNSALLTGFEKAAEKTVINLEDESVPTMITQPVLQPVNTIVENTIIEETTTESFTEESTITFKSEEEEMPYLKIKDETVSQTEINWSFSSESVKESSDEISFESKSETFESSNSDSFVSKKEDVTEEKEDVIRHMLTDDLDERFDSNDNLQTKTPLSLDEQQKRTKERMERIQSYTSKLKTSSGLSDLEKEPAYKRKNVAINDIPHSSEDQMSKFTLSEETEDGKRKFGLKENNSFLHDNVD
ncbi:MAG: cell division protein FtsZ [Crocinitomicaceae bacterium]|nr:cell division protein FtsZ [Crocinitomicaceae bacterium]